MVIFGLWFLSGINLDPAKSGTTDQLWNYLTAVGGVGVLAIAAAAAAAWAGAVVTVVSQAVMAVLVCIVVLSGVEVQSHQDQWCRDIPSAVGCEDHGSARP
ncbi:DUF6234 family protein [Streptomyces iakyrus]|uniref:DUF6234 family protein n=1 Tax=Streptomyces iakyrus TaxID=68219 RepID=UPI0033D20E8A